MHTLALNTELAWDIDNHTLSQLKSSRTPVRISIYSLNTKTLLGSCNIDVRTAQVVTNAGEKILEKKVRLLRSSHGGVIDLALCVGGKDLMSEPLFTTKIRANNRNAIQASKSLQELKRNSGLASNFNSARSLSIPQSKLPSPTRVQTPTFSKSFSSPIKSPLKSTLPMHYRISISITKAHHIPHPISLLLKYSHSLLPSFIRPITLSFPTTILNLYAAYELLISKIDLKDRMLEGLDLWIGDEYKLIEFREGEVTCLFEVGEFCFRVGIEVIGEVGVYDDTENQAQKIKNDSMYFEEDIQNDRSLNETDSLGLNIVDDIRLPAHSSVVIPEFEYQPKSTIAPTNMNVMHHDIKENNASFTSTKSNHKVIVAEPIQDHKNSSLNIKEPSKSPKQAISSPQRFTGSTVNGLDIHLQNNTPNSPPKKFTATPTKSSYTVDTQTSYIETPRMSRWDELKVKTTEPEPTRISPPMPIVQQHTKIPIHVPESPKVKFSEVEAIKGTKELLESLTKAYEARQSNRDVVLDSTLGSLEEYESSLKVLLLELGRREEALVVREIAMQKVEREVNAECERRVEAYRDAGRRLEEESVFKYGLLQKKYDVCRKEVVGYEKAKQLEKAAEAEREKDRLRLEKSQDTERKVLRTIPAAKKNITACNSCGLDSTKYEKIENELVSLKVNEGVLKKERDSLMRIVVQLRKSTDRGDLGKMKSKSKTSLENLKSDIQAFKENIDQYKDSNESNIEFSEDIKRLMRERKMMKSAGYTNDDWLMKQVEGKIRELTVNT